MRFCKWLSIAMMAGLASVAQAQSVTLSWDASCAFEVVGYELCYGPASKEYVACADVGNVTSVTYSLAGIAPGTTYYVAARAYGDDPHLDSDFSNEVVVTVPGPAGCPPQMHAPVVEPAHD